MSAVHPLSDLRARVGRRRALPPELAARYRQAGRAVVAPPPGIRAAALPVALRPLSPPAAAVRAAPPVLRWPNSATAAPPPPDATAVPAPRARPLLAVLGRIALTVTVLCALVVLVAALGNPG